MPLSSALEFVSREAPLLVELSDRLIVQDQSVPIDTVGGPPSMLSGEMPPRLESSTLPPLDAGQRRQSLWHDLCGGASVHRVD
jgi:hypothetical protein